MSVCAGPKIPTDDLTFIVDPSNIKSYPGSGTIWYDLSSNKIILNSAGTLTPLVTVNNTLCFQLNDSGYWISSLSDGQKTDLRFGATLIFWFRSVGNYAERDTIFEKAGVGTNSYRQELAVTIETDNDFTYYRNANVSLGGINYDSGSSSNHFISNVWVHTAIVLESMPNGVGKVYKNGSLYSTSYSLRGTTDISNKAGAITIGSGYAAVCETGNFSIFKIYEKVLSDEEIQQDFNSVRGRFGI